MVQYTLESASASRHSSTTFIPCRTITILSETGPRVTDDVSSLSLEGALRDWVLLSRSAAADPADADPEGEASSGLCCSLVLCLRLPPPPPPRLLLPGRRCPLFLFLFLLLPGTTAMAVCFEATVTTSESGSEGSRRSWT